MESSDYEAKVKRQLQKKEVVKMILRFLCVRVCFVISNETIVIHETNV